MAALTSENLSDEFLKAFLPETLFLLEGEQITTVPEAEAAVPTPAVPQHAATAPQPEAIPQPAAAPKAEPVAPPAHVVPPSVPQKHVTDLPKIPKVELPVKPKAFEVLGQNKKGVAILVTLPAQEFQALPNLQFLTKILSAIGLQPADVAFVNNVSGQLASFEELTKALQVNYIISFASRVTTDLPHDKFTLYNPVTVGTVPIVFSQSLAVLDKDVEQKKLLWGALQQVFL